MPPTSRRAPTLLLLLALVGSACASQREGTTDPASWYRRSRALDLTGTNPRDSIVLTAVGTHADSLSITMTFFVDGVDVYRQEWTSDYELYDVDSLRNAPKRLDAYLRARLDDIVAMVRRTPIDPEQVRYMGEEAVLDSITPRPSHQVMLSFAFETSVFLAWDPARRQLVNFMECC